MDASQQERAIEMVDQLKHAGTNCGFLAIQATVVMRCPGSPCTDTPTTFDETDLQNAISLGLVRKQKIVGSFEWEYYVLPPTVYRVRISAEEWQEFETPVKASRLVADNILYGYPAELEIRNAKNFEKVREEFKNRIEQRLQELGHTKSFWCHDNSTGSHFRLYEHQTPR